MAEAIAQTSTNDQLNEKLNSEEKREEIRKKAFIPTQLPDDFLRVVLNNNQIKENNDGLLAQHLQRSFYAQDFNLMDGFQAPRAVQPTQTTFRGKLQVDLIEAKLNKNYGFLKMDPYVRIKVGNKVYETPSDNGGGKNPKWRKTIMCYLPVNVNLISIEIYDEKSLSDDELIAFVKYPLPEKIFEGSISNEWIPLSGKLGEHKEGQLNIQLLFIPNETRRTAETNPQLSPTNNNATQTNPNATNVSSTNTLPNDFIQPSNQVQLPTDELSTNQITLIYSDTDLKSIVEMFPTFDSEIIKSVLEANDGNKEATIDILLQMIASN